MPEEKKYSKIDALNSFRKVFEEALNEESEAMKNAPKRFDPEKGEYILENWNRDDVLDPLPTTTKK